MATEKIDHTYPLFLQPSDTPGLILIPIQLTGFVTGKCAKEMYKDALLEEWETCNAIVHSWIMNSVSKDLLSGIIYALNAHAVWEDLKEHFDKVNRVRIFQLHRSISRLSQGSDSVSVYFTKLKELWVEYDVLVRFPDCGCPRSKEYMIHLHQQRVMQFLDGLNDTYEQARRQILLKTTEPTLNQAYALIFQDESQQSMGSVSMADKGDPLAMQAGRGQGYRGKKQFLQRDHCRMKGHTKENCFTIIGYPEDFKGRKPFQLRGTLTAANHVEGSTTQSSQATTQSKGDYFSQRLNINKFWDCSTTKTHQVKLQLKLIMQLRDRWIALSSNAEAVNELKDIWIVDSGATHHISSTLDFTSDVSKITDKGKEKVTLPIGGCAKIEHVGSSFLSAFDKLKNVLHVPDFKFNLMVKAIGKEDEGLYVLKGRGIRQLAAHVGMKVTAGDTGDLWHMRLGHAFIPVMQHVSFLQNKVDSEIQNKCSVCPLANQCRLSFPDSEKE
ncbi:PREDICTED: uncharacterized protein LOC109240779 [Nicotiana attenuata]|uniref:uncharacterized protein LOC109240779 n=1 Tax=Nicotiana attenuata TaxID=49451 RepID=UPI0009052E2E|nr:PREDICTED: uncharacterized protein LOC109240779 [Nicotiana attenuata]